MIRIAQGVAGERILDADARDDIAGLGDVDWVALRRVHLEHARDVFALVAAAVQHARALFEAAAVDADVGEVAVLIVDDLEREAAERLLGGELADDFLFGVLARSWPTMWSMSCGAGQIIDDGIEHLLHADVLEGRPAEDRVGLERDRRLAKGVPEFLLR